MGGRFAEEPERLSRGRLGGGKREMWTGTDGRLEGQGKESAGWGGEALFFEGALDPSSCTFDTVPATPFASMQVQWYTSLMQASHS